MQGTSRQDCLCLHAVATLAAEHPAEMRNEQRGRARAKQEQGALTLRVLCGQVEPPDGEGEAGGAAGVNGLTGLTGWAGPVVSNGAGAALLLLLLLLLLTGAASVATSMVSTSQEQRPWTGRQIK
jgi:hypothetical protein